MARSSIEKFISNYIRNKKISESREGYEAWLRKNGIDPTSELSDEIGMAYAEKERTGSQHSNTAENLSDIGLTRSGYAKYIGEGIEKKKSANVSKAIQSYLTADSANRLGYTNELEMLEQIRLDEEKKSEQEKLKAEQKAQQEAKKAAEIAAKEAAKKEENRLKKEEKIKEQRIKDARAGIEVMSTIDYKKAHKYALEMGLDESSAQKIAKTVTEEKRSAAISKITNAIISKRLTMNQTKQYALALGLSEEDANALSELAFKTNESVRDIISENNYLDYLREQIR